MFVMDMIDLPLDEAPVVMLAESKQGENGMGKGEKRLGLCYVVGKRAEENIKLQAGVDPWFFVSEYFREFEKKDIVLPYGTEGPRDEVNITILQQPTNGTLIRSESSNYFPIFYYQADEGYYGKDRATILGEVNGHEVAIQIYLHMVETRTFNMDEVCADTGYIWKISEYLDNSGDSIPN